MHTAPTSVQHYERSADFLRIPLHSVHNVPNSPALRAIHSNVPNFAMAHLHNVCEVGGSTHTCAASGAVRQAILVSCVGGYMLTIAKLKRWSINYYNDTARAAGTAAKCARKANGGLSEYYSEGDTRAPVWVVVGDTGKAAKLVGLSDAEGAEPKRISTSYSGGSTTASCPTAHRVGRLQLAVCMASI